MISIPSQNTLNIPMNTYIYNTTNQQTNQPVSQPTKRPANTYINITWRHPVGTPNHRALVSFPELDFCRDAEINELDSSPHGQDEIGSFNVLRIP